MLKFLEVVLSHQQIFECVLFGKSCGTQVKGHQHFTSTLELAAKLIKFDDYRVLVVNRLLWYDRIIFKHLVQKKLHLLHII